MKKNSKIVCALVVLSIVVVLLLVLMSHCSKKEEISFVDRKKSSIVVKDKKKIQKIESKKFGGGVKSKKSGVKGPSGKIGSQKKGSDSSTGGAPPSDVQEVKQQPKPKKSDGKILGVRQLSMPNNKKISMIEVSKGSFQVGGEPVWDVKDVEIKSNFSMSETEITQDMFLALFPDFQFVHSQNERYPAENISWEMAVDFCKKLTEHLRKTKQISDDESVNLPTEYQWEYVSKCDTPDVSNNIWTRTNSGFSVKDVATKQKNLWGFFDMFGNVSEWCRNSYNPEGACSIENDLISDIKIVKGGDYTMAAVAASERGAVHKQARASTIGFRIVLEKNRK